MRIALFDAIQEAHVGNSLERALVAAGHEVYSTGRIGKAFMFRDTEDFFRTVRPHLERIADFRPDWVLVFRPGSAPLPVLQALRATGASLAVWFSDDPVLFDLSYGPVVDLYDLVLHCGSEKVLQFYEERFGRPTGVNFPFWTDHEAFPRVYGRHEPETTVLFLGNVSGPVRRRRYEQLAGMRHRVGLFGQAGDDPARLGRGFLDTDAEVVEAGARSRVALNIPQFFRDHRGLQTWFPGLDELGFFDLPSRVVQYAAMGLPTVNIIPGVSGIPAFPELVVCGSVEEADEWIGDALADGRLPALSEAMAARFDRSFSAAARVQALESLMTDDGWRGLDAAERALWFLQFDGTRSPGAATPGAANAPAPAATDGPVVLGTASPAEPEPPQVPDRETMPAVVVVHGREPARFSPAEVVLRELRSEGSTLVELGPQDLAALLGPAEPPFTGTLDVGAFLAAHGAEAPCVMVLAEGMGLTAEAPALLRRAGIATVCLVRDEMLSPDQVARFDLVVGVGPASVDRVALVEASVNALRSPGLVDTAFLRAVRDRTTRDGATVVRSGENAIADWVLGAVPGPASDLTAPYLAEADTDELAGLLARQVVYLHPTERDRRRAHQPVTPYAVCAAGAVLTARHRSAGTPEIYGDQVLKVDSPEEAALKLSWHAEQPPIPDPRERIAGRHRTYDARRQLARWFRLASATAAAGGPTGSMQDPALADATETAVRLDRPYVLDTSAITTAPGESITARLWFDDPGFVRGLVVRQSGRTLAEARFPAGSVSAVDLTLSGLAGGDPVAVEFLGDPLHRVRGAARVLVRTRTAPGPRIHGAVTDAGPSAYLMPVIPAGKGHTA